MVVDLSKVELHGPVHAYEYLGILNQKWIFTYNKDYKAYHIKNKQNPELVLDAKSSNDKSGVWVKSAGDISSLWLPELTQDGYYKLRNYAYPKLMLDLAGGGTSNGNRIQIAEDSKDPQYLPNQKWFFNRVDQGIVADGEYAISTKLNYKKVIDFYQDKFIIVLNDNWNLGTSAWELRYYSTKKAYKIYTYMDANMHQGLYYQGKNFNISIENLGLYDDSDLRPYWTIEYNVSKGGYIIRSLHDPTQVLTLKDSKLDNSTPIISSSINNGNNQIWNLMTWQ
ncbi:hypothetical protein A5802_002982 [Enterococcus mundtii]|uniref:Ricin B lectin domain-containing protein n=1 Tax=Enterococcus mundtii TaxID=53346 RepID=A0A242KUB0_ENTMU|nr:hypothetical protein A5802_002982 [Enterococcus mundtii]